MIIAFLTLTSMISSVLSSLPPLSGFVWILALQLVTVGFTLAAILQCAWSGSRAPLEGARSALIR